MRGYTQLAQQVRTPLQMGENYYGARDRRALRTEPLWDSQD
jgi:hypothetical protein